MKESIVYSRYTSESKTKINEDINKNIEQINIAEGKTVERLLKQLNAEHEENVSYFEPLDIPSDSSSMKADIASDNGSNSNNKESDSCNKPSDNNNNTNSNTDKETKQSPLDYVLEKQACEMPA